MADFILNQCYPKLNKLWPQYLCYLFSLVIGVAIHLISAETGGSDEIIKRLADRGTRVRWPVHSDPEHLLLLPVHGAETTGVEVHSLYVKKEKAASQYGGTYEDYIMVQPALVVVNKSETIQQVWSWNTEPLDKVKVKEEMLPVGDFNGATLVSIRSVSSDLGPSIQENRRVKLRG